MGGRLVGVTGREEEGREEGGRREGRGEPCSRRLTASAAPHGGLPCFCGGTPELTRFCEAQYPKLRASLSVIYPQFSFMLLNSVSGTERWIPLND